MARQDMIVATCDPCDFAGVSNVPAVTSHVLSIDGGPLLEVDFCAVDDRILQSIFRAYKDGGRPVPTKQEPASAKKPRAKKAVKTVKPKELEQAPVEAPPAETPVAPQEEPEKWWKWPGAIRTPILSIWHRAASRRFCLPEPRLRGPQ